MCHLCLACPTTDLKRELRTKREELLLRTVAALPNASNTGLASKILRSTSECLFVHWARNCMVSLVASVLPAPDSPLSKITATKNTVSDHLDSAKIAIYLIMTAWLRFDAVRAVYAAFAVA